MELLHERIKHKSLGPGEIIGFDGTYVTIQFASKISKFTYPSAFESFLVLDNADKQGAVLAEITRAQHAAEEEKRKKTENERKAALSAREFSTNCSKVKTIDEMFSEDYHAAYLARQPILTYQQVEEQFGIQISGFGNE